MADPTPTITLPELRRRAQERIPGLEEAYKQAQAASVAQPEFSRNEALAQILVGVLPILAGGLIKGKEGLGAGGRGAAAGQKVYLENRKEEAERKAKREQLELESRAKQLEAAQKELGDIDMTLGKEELQRETKRMYPDKGIQVNLPGDAKLSEKLAAAQITFNEANELKRFIEEKFSKQLKEGENLGQVLFRLSKGQLPETDQRELSALIKKFKVKTTPAMVIGNPSTIENKEVYDAITGGEWSSVGDIYKFVSKFGEDSLRDARKEFDTSLALSDLQAGRISREEALGRLGLNGDRGRKTKFIQNSKGEVLEVPIE